MAYIRFCVCGRQFITPSGVLIQFLDLLTMLLRAASERRVGVRVVLGEHATSARIPDVLARTSTGFSCKLDCAVHLRLGLMFRQITYRSFPERGATVVPILSLRGCTLAPVDCELALPEPLLDREA